MQRQPSAFRRAPFVAGLVVVVPLGLLTKLYSGPGSSWLASYVGGFFYVVFWVFLVLAALPRLAPGPVSVGVLAATCAIEVLQLWHPRFLEPVRASFFGHALLGSTFAWSDFPYYVAGSLFAYGAARLLSSPGSGYGGRVDRAPPRRSGRDLIYHLVPESEFRTSIDGPLYRPARLGTEGFVHCALKRSVLSVADDYFGDTSGAVLLLEIDPDRLSCETRFEAAAPLPGGGTAHLDSALVFPHVYGPIDLEAVDRIGVLGRSAAGFRWPEELLGPDIFLSNADFRRGDRAGGR